MELTAAATISNAWEYRLITGFTEFRIHLHTDFHFIIVRKVRMSLPFANYLKFDFSQNLFNIE